jgi:hypothetical protein
VKLGRRRPVAKGPRLRFANYRLASLPVPPAACGYENAAAAALTNVYLNDSLGDCVIAGMAHIEGVLSGGAGDEVLYTDDQITALYSAIGGYVPGDSSTDNGCDEETALNYWQRTGAPAGSHKITGYLEVNAADPVEVRTALWLFENLMFGIELPDAWISPFPSSNGFIWDVAGPSDPANGHCVVGVGYTSSTIAIATWGMIGFITDAAVAQYASGQGGQLFAVLSQDSIAKATALAPNGFDFSQLQADFQAING